jgi:hypothetical protein
MKKMLEKTDFKNIIILSTIILLIGGYLIATTVLISKDGILYINCAKEFAGKPFIDTVRNLPVSIGYPFMIYLAHNVSGLFSNTEFLQSWILSAQTTSLVSKLIASVALYFIGSFLVGRKAAFWGVLILSFLPDSAEYGSDAITEWPHLMFLCIGFLVLLWGSRLGNIWMFGLAGIIAGLGYLIRAEACQLVIYGGAWLTFCLIRPQNKISRPKASVAIVLLATGFTVVTLPYMIHKGYAFPEQELFKISANLSHKSINVKFDNNSYKAGLLSSTTIGNKSIIKNISETLIYYFIPWLVIGCYYCFRTKLRSPVQRFYIGVFVFLNLAFLLWNETYNHFISRRHTLALVVFTIFFMPAGIELFSNWLSKKTNKSKPGTENRSQFLFHILIIIGISICLFKLINHDLMQKIGYRDVSLWLNKNTTSKDKIAVQDPRISFYAERSGIEYEKNLPANMDYVVRSTSKNVINDMNSNFEEKYSAWVNKKKDRKITIYKIIH